MQENGPERADIKENLFSRLDAILPADVVLASSSSGLPMTPVQAACRFPERIMLGHPFNPPHLIPLVEVVGGVKTSDAMIETAMAFYAAIGKKPIRLRRELKGHVANRLQAALWREVFHLVDIGAATVADIEVAIAHGPGLRWGALGPFAHLHLSGGDGGIAYLLGHLGGPIESWWDDLGAPRMSPALVARVAEQTNAYYGASTMSELGAWRDANHCRPSQGQGQRRRPLLTDPANPEDYPMLSNKVIVTIAPTGGMASKKQNPNLPTQPEEIAATLSTAGTLGPPWWRYTPAAPTIRRPAIPKLSRINSRIREKSDIIINNSTGGGINGDMVRQMPNGH